MIEVISFPVEPLGCNCSILKCESTGEAIVIDPGGEADRIIETLNKHNCKVRHIVHTHAHFDHVLATDEVAKFCRSQKDERNATDASLVQSSSKEASSAKETSPTPCRVGLHKGDQFLYDGLAAQCRFFGIPPQKATTPIDHWIEDNEELRFGKHALEILHTPGHTPGSCSFHLPEKGILFSGDTLFARSIGRTDLPGGDTELILKSIRERLFRLDDGTTVIPGHGGLTRIYEEKHNNPFF